MKEIKDINQIDYIKQWNTFVIARWTEPVFGIQGYVISHESAIERWKSKDSHDWTVNAYAEMERIHEEKPKPNHVQSVSYYPVSKTWFRNHCVSINLATALMLWRRKDDFKWCPDALKEMNRMERVQDERKGVES